MNYVFEAGKRALGMEFVRENTGEHSESLGTATLFVDDRSPPRAR